MKINQIKMGAILSYINLAIGSIIPMIYTPIMLDILGQAEYGLYSLSSSVTSYLTLLNFGFGTAIIRYICKYRAENKMDELRKVYGVFLIIYALMSAIVIVAGLFIVLSADVLFSKGLTNSEILKLKYLISIMTISVAVNFPASVFSSIIISYERFIFKRFIDVFATILAPVANLVLLFLGFGSIGMAMVSLMLHLITLPLYIWYCSNKLKVTPLFKIPSKKFIKELITFSLFVFIASIVDTLFWATDKVLLGALAGSTVVAVYNVGATFNTIVGQLSQSISVVITPKINAMVTTDGDNKTALTDIFIKVGRVQYLVLALVVSGFIAFGKPFINLWAGAEYGEAYCIALLTMLPLVIPYIQNTGLSIVVAQNKHKFRAVVYLIIAMLNVVSTYFTIPYFGGIGAALCSCVSYVLGQGFIMNIYYRKVTGINIPLFWKNIISMSIFPMILCVTTIVLSSYINFYSWVSLLIGILIYTILYLVGSYLISMNTYEKNLLVVPVKKIVNKIFK